MNKDTTNKQCAYFLILNGNSITENQERFEVLHRLIRESKISLSEANTSEISQICNQL
jgi:prophage maintenance system killer protein